MSTRVDSGRGGTRVPGGAVLGLVVCLLAVVTLVWTLPEDKPDRRAYAIVKGEDWSTWRDLQVRLVRAQTVTSVESRYGDRVTAGEDAAFVVVEYQLRSLREPVSLTHELVIDGLRVDTLGRLSRIPSGPAQPGFTQTGTVVYQVPRDRLPTRALSVLEPPARGLMSYSEFPALQLQLDRPGDAVAAPAEATVEVSR